MEEDAIESNKDLDDTDSQEVNEQVEVGSEEAHIDQSNMPSDIHHGEALTLTESSAITLKNKTQIIFIVGPVKSGKTTLIASLFHLFQKGPFMNYKFAGSETLLGFDMRCHLARTASFRDTQDTHRTRPYDDRKLLHLRLRKNNENSSKKDLLFYDISGENFERAKNSIEECKELHLLKRFDHLSILLDGEKLLKIDERQKAFSDTRMLLRSFIDSNIINDNALVDILFTKWDIVDSDPDKEESLAFMTHITKSITDTYKDSVRRLRFFNIAARPDDAIFPLGYGLDKVFESWVEESPYTIIEYNNKLTEPESLCEFDRFYKRYLPNYFGE